MSVLRVVFIKSIALPLFLEAESRKNLTAHLVDMSARVGECVLPPFYSHTPYHLLFN